jgi:ubiquitin C-terminal hydrolase
VLSIQLKRFGYSNKAEPRKLNHFVEYPEVLQLHQYLNYGDENVSQGSRKTRNSSVSRNTSNSASILNLFAVIVHYGTDSLTYLLTYFSLTHLLTRTGANISNGHYVAYIKCNNEWHRTDDGHVSPCSSHEALDQNAYILFYTRSDIDVDYGTHLYSLIH